VLEIEELATAGISSADVKTVTPKVIAATFEEIVHKKCVWEQLYRDNRDILNKPGMEVVFPGATATGAFSVGVAEFVDVTTIGTTVGLDQYTATTIGIKKVAGHFNVTREAIKFGMRDAIKDNIYETGLQYVEAIDNVAYYQVMFGSYSTAAQTETSLCAAGDTLGLAGAAYSLATNIIEVNSVNTSALSGSLSGVCYIDYKSGTLYMGGSSIVAEVGCSIWVTRGLKPGVYVNSAKLGTTSTGISGWGILDGKAALIAEGRDPNVVLMNYADLPNLLYDDKINFLDASAYGGREPLMNAEVGKVWGLKVITENRRIPQGCALVVDTSRMGYDVHKEELTSYREDVYKRDAVYYYFYAERGFGITDTLTLCGVLGGTPIWRGTHPAGV